MLQKNSKQENLIVFLTWIEIIRIPDAMLCQPKGNQMRLITTEPTVAVALTVRLILAASANVEFVEWLFGAEYMLAIQPLVDMVLMDKIKEVYLIPIKIATQKCIQ